MSLTSTHLLCGAGGDTKGFAMAGFTPVLAANHSSRVIETHAANFPDTEHLVADVSNIDFRRLPRTDALWASPVCTEISPAGGRRRDRRNPDQLALLEYGSVDDATWERTRTTAYEVLRATEICQYPVVACENVIEFATDWPLFRWWVQAMDILEYNATIACVSSAHIGSDDNPHAPQWRDRVYILFTRKDLGRLPDLEPHPLAFCPECGGDVASEQWWKNPGGPRIGKYRQQYVYGCPATSHRPTAVEPYVRPAAAAIDWSDIGARIGDRPRPLAEATRRRIQIGLDTLACHQSVVTVNHGGDDPRAYPVHAAPLATRTKKIGDGLLTPPMLVPCGGTRNETATAVTDPMRTRLTRDMECVVTPPFIAELRRNGTARGVDEPLATITAGGTHHALVVPYYRTGRAKWVGDPLDTVTVRDRFALVTGETVEVDDCYLRMIQPRESLRGQAFPDDYVVTGNKGEQTAQAGNAVSVNVAHWVGRAAAAVLSE